MKAARYQRPRSGFMAIHMPKNTGAGFVISALAAAVGFALVGQMWLLAGLAMAAMIAAIIAHTFNYKRDYYIPEADVTRTENARTLLLDSHA
jgi:cytochrome o ubiquinol oxidase subunit 1